jgi:hypothetical protein
MQQANGVQAPEPVVFYLDPICGWTYRAMLWLRAVRAVRPLTVEWRFFSLARNQGRDWTESRSGLAFQALALARRLGGAAAVERLYLALGEPTRERRDEFPQPAFVEAALRRAELSPDLLARAQADPSVRAEVEAEHDAAVERYRAFGVPLIVLDGGAGPYLFGPVIRTVPTGEDAGAMWDHFVWFARRPEFYELKRPR